MKVPCEACGGLAEAKLLGRPEGAVLVCASCGAEKAAPGEGEAPASSPADDEAAWSRLRGRWAEPAAHDAFLSRFADLDGLAVVGARYREVLEASPLDAAALRARDEILRRAALLGLKTGTRAESSAGAAKTRWGAVVLVAAALVAVVAWVIRALAGPGATRGWR